MKPRGSQFQWTKPRVENNEYASKWAPTANHYDNGIGGGWGGEPSPSVNINLHAPTGRDGTMREHGDLRANFPVREHDTHELLDDSTWSMRAEAGKKPVKDKSTKQKLKYTNAEGEKVKQKTVQQRLFDPQHTAGWRNGVDQPVVSYAEFSKPGSSRLAEGLGILQNESYKRGFGQLVPDTDLSKHSNALVERQKSTGIVSESHERLETNEMNFMPDKGEYASSRHPDEYLPKEEAAAGMRTARSILGRGGRERIRERKAARMNQQLPGFES